MITLHLLESDNTSVGGVLLTYNSGHKQVVTWHGACSGSIREMGQALATRALDDLLKKGRQADASEANWASIAASCGELHRQWKERRRH